MLMQDQPDLKVPEGAMVTGCLSVAAYISPDGTNSYVVAARGDLPMTTYLGLLVAAQQEVLGWGS